MQTMPHIYPGLTALTPKSLFPPLGLLGLFTQLNGQHKAPAHPQPPPQQNSPRQGEGALGGVGERKKWANLDPST